MVDDGDVIMATTSQGSGSDLILDSGCSFHMCTIREHFDNYRACDVGMVRMANGAESRIAGIGSVQMACSTVLCEH